MTDSLRKKLITLLEKYSINLYDVINEIIPITISEAKNRYNFIINYQKCIHEDLLITLDLLNDYYPLTIINKKYQSVISERRDIGKDITRSAVLPPSVILPHDSVAHALQMFLCDDLIKKYKYKYNNSKQAELLWFSILPTTNLVSFIDNINFTLLKKGGDVLIKIDSTPEILSIKDLQTVLNKYNFTEYYFIYLSYPCLTQLFKNPIYLYISGYQGNPDGQISGIGPDIASIKLFASENIKNWLTEVTELPGRSTETLHKYILENLISFYRNNLNLKINHIYSGKYHFNTWKKTLHGYSSGINNILELGVYQGDASLFFLDNLMAHEQSRLHLVDTWAGSVEYNREIDWERVMNTFSMNILNAPNSEKIVIHRKTSNEMLNKFIKQGMRFDIIFIDANHDSRAVMLDAMLAWRVTKIGGTIIFDDYTWTKMPHEWERPKIAIDSFLEIYQENIEVIYKKAQVMIKKISEYDKEIG
jgi:predicted O-methyltransferase YrrM